MGLKCVWKNILVFLAFVSQATFAAGAQTCGGETIVPLLEKKGDPLGTLTISNNESYIFIQYAAVPGWHLKKTKLDIETSIAKKADSAKSKYSATGLNSRTYAFSIDRAKSGYVSLDAIYLSVKADLISADGRQHASVRAMNEQLKKHPKNTDYLAYHIQSCESRFTPGVDATLTRRNVGPYGDAFEITGTGTPLDGVTINIPAGALDRNTTFTVGYNTGRLATGVGRPSNAVLTIDAGPIEDFGQPVTISVPFTGDSSVVPVPYYVDSQGRFQLAQLVDIDRSANRFVFQTFHASWFTWVLADVGLARSTFATAYTPPADGFQVTNRGAVYGRGGESLGMSSFSQWFYRTQKPRIGRLFPKYYDVVGVDATGASLRGQNIIATWAFLAIARQWNSYLPAVALQQRLSIAERIASVKNALLNTGNPVVLYLYGGSPGAHSVLAYGFSSDASGARIRVYDPNYPADTGRTITYSRVRGLDRYCTSPSVCFSNVINLGDGSLSLARAYQHIVDSAQQSFQSNTNATLFVTTHANGQQVQTRSIVLSGTVSGGSAPVTKLTVFVGTTSFATNVGVNGLFSIPVELSNGVNHLQFRTEGPDASGNHLIPVANNFATTDFVLHANVPSAVVLMTLTWDTNDTDLDAYVVDPTGDYSAYYHRVTQDGGTLDRDVTTGYGPEHWTLLTTNTVRYGQPYHFRVHYYSDHGHGPSNYNVTIKLYEATPREVTYTFRGNLAFSNPANNAPNGQGPDWANIASISLEESAAESGISALASPASPNISIRADSGIRITAPIPPPEQRMKR